jgi:flagellar P-ring protein FlgI
MPGTAPGCGRKKPMRLFILRWSAALLAVLGLAASASPALAASRIKDIVQFEGVRGNQLVGYGLVVGLAGTGDSLRNAPMTQQSMIDMLERLGVNTRGATMDTKDIAAVMVTANLPAFAAAGSTIDVRVSAMADAKSLQGGTLLVTPLLGGDGEAYAVAQGSIETGSIAASGASGSSIIKGVATAGRIAAGANVEREVGFQLAKMGVLRLTLHNPDFTTARRIADVINAHYAGTALAESPTIVALHSPAGQDMVSFITSVENLEVEPDAPAKVVIDEVTGVVVMGDKVRLSTVAIAQGNLTISVQENPTVSQPSPLSQGVTTIVPQSTVKVDEQKGKKLIIIKESASLASLVAGLNALGVTPRDMISILQAIKADGALQADIEVM